MPCQCPHDDLVTVTSGVAYCRRCKHHVTIVKRVDYIARSTDKRVNLLKQRHRPPPEEIPDLVPSRRRQRGQCPCCK